MKKSIIALGILAATALGTTFTSCQDMLTVDTGDKAYVNANDTLYSYLGILRTMQDVAERQIILGEIRGDLVAATEYTTDTLFAISNFDNPRDKSCSMLQVSDYYNIINNCNFYIHNCDTSAVKSNVKYMIPEYAQVNAIRAWAYLQLVKNYGEVPFITQPINNLSVVNNFDYKNNLVNKDNLIDKLIDNGLEKFIDTRYPGFNSWENGYTSIDARLCYIPVRVLLGDLYLMRGNGQADYEKAAKYYYDYLKNEVTPQPLSCVEITNYNAALQRMSYKTTNGYATWAATYNYNTTSTEVVSLIPGSANAGLGKMLTRVADIFGYTPSSSQSSNETINQDNDGTGEFESSGAISVSRNYKRQYAPSQAYSSVVGAQTCVFYPTNTSSTSSAQPVYVENYDARDYLTVENYSYESNLYPLCAKAAKGMAFYYTIPIYRKTLVWLRLAEAINRAGFPEYAFGILKDGLNQYNLPKLGNRYVPSRDKEHGCLIIDNNRLGITVYLDDKQEPPTYYYYNEEHQWVVYEGEVKGGQWVQRKDTIPEDSIYPAGSHRALHYVTDKEQIRNFGKFLNFSDDIWNSTYGVHARGAGFGNETSPNKDHRITNITGIRDTVAYDYYKVLARHGVQVGVSSKEEVINAVENIIVDELALECAFEGNRFTDLVRIAQHKNYAGQNGTEWLAKKVASRGAAKTDAKPVEELDNHVYSQLLNPANWYFTLPEWTVK